MFKNYLIIACIFSACAKPPAHVKKTDDILKPFAKEQETKYALHSLGQGGFFVENKVDIFYADFDTKEVFSEEQAVDFLYEIAYDLQNSLNNDEGLRPYLWQYPVDLEKVSISVSFVDHKKQPRERFSQIHLYKGFIHYSSYDDATKSYISYKEEPLKSNG